MPDETSEIRRTSPTREIRLANWADRLSVLFVASVETIGFVIPRGNHIRLHAGHRSQLIAASNRMNSEFEQGDTGHLQKLLVQAFVY
jgi:hypothetical protein